MKKIIGSFILIILALLWRPAYAGPEAVKGASPQAFEHASDQSVFNRVSDWFATIGKSKEERDAILAERKAQRAADRAARQAEKLGKRAEKEGKKAGKEAEEGSGSAQKAAKQAAENAQGQGQAGLKDIKSKFGGEQ